MIPGDSFLIGSERVIIRSVDFGTGLAKCERESNRHAPSDRFRFIEVEAGHCANIDRVYCKRVLQAQVAYVKQYVDGNSKYKGKFKLSKDCLKRAEARLEPLQ